MVLPNHMMTPDQHSEPIDVTGVPSSEVQELAMQAAQATPGLNITGIDCIVESPVTASTAVVLRANAAVNIALHHIPANGALSM